LRRNTDWLFNTAVATSGPLAVILIRMIGGGADIASADPLAAPQAVSLEDLHDLVLPSDELRAAWAESEAVWARAETGTPPTEDQPNPIPAPSVPRGTVVPPRLVLSAILGGARRGAAVLDERIYWVGDDLGYGWRLDRVDHQSRTATLRHESGQEHRIEFAQGD